METLQASKLKVKDVDLCLSQNRKKHHTDKYADKRLIVRRGDEFAVEVKFHRNFNVGDDVITLKFDVCTNPQDRKVPAIRVEAKDDLPPSGWGVKIESSKGKTVSLTVRTSAEAVVGHYDLFVDTRRESGGSADEKDTPDKKIIVLFNAWCNDDSVFMGDEEERNEYVTNERGLIWVLTKKKGSEESFRAAKPWKFGQFDDKILDAALYLLRANKMETSRRASPIHVVRCISAMANSNDEDGILNGCWVNCTYDKGTKKPCEWTGSVEIIKKYMETKIPVRFGQCWVFSGIATSLCRSLGIPTRSVTNFKSAHDTDGSTTIDYHYDEDGNAIKGLNSDSIWNYHVWNEAWFKRPDLPEGHDGWQVFDATPQEPSGGVRRCGPASVKAVKEGEVYLPYDTRFVFAEVNGDKVYWTVKKDGSIVERREADGKTKKKTDSIGLQIITKKVGKGEKKDVTLEYKFKEKSKEERNAVMAAYAYSSRADKEIYDNPPTDVTFSLDVKHDVKTVGDVFNVTVQMRNESAEVRTVKTTIYSEIAFNTWDVEDCKYKVTEYQLQPGERDSVVLSIEPGDYLGKLTKDGEIRIYAKAKVAEKVYVFPEKVSVNVLKRDATQKENPDTDL